MAVTVFLLACVLGVGYGVTDHVLQKYLENTASLFVDETGDTLHATTTSQATNCSLGDSLDVVAEDVPVVLGTSFSETFAFACLPRPDTMNCFSWNSVETAMLFFLFNFLKK